MLMIFSGFFDWTKIKSYKSSAQPRAYAIKNGPEFRSSGPKYSVQKMGVEPTRVLPH